MKVRNQYRRRKIVACGRMDLRLNVDVKHIQPEQAKDVRTLRYWVLRCVAITVAMAPQVKAAARARLENAADRMARNLLGLATEAESETVKLGATNSALDRAGLKPPAEVVLSLNPWMAAGVIGV